ncbi:MAG: tRNA (guanosine(46)-N7)-methyltransferase TrmB [Steroidobacteraceae bacterium]
MERRGIRSFVQRAGRITEGQRRALAELWPRYGIEAGEEPIDLEAAFGRRAPVTLEIGFGDGESTVALAGQHPERNLLGIEVHPPGVGHCLLLAERAGLTNLRVISQDAIEVLARRLPDACLDEVLLYFPDPWPKKRHHKRRIVQPEFVALLARKLAPGGVFRLATDWAPYAEHMLEVMSASADFENLSPSGDWVERPSSRPITRFERRGGRLGHVVRDLAFRRR